MRILHTYCVNYNLGDHALGVGVKSILRHFLDVDLIGETNIQGTNFDESFINKINREYDLLVIGGGGIIHGAHWPNGWFWLIDKNNIKEIRIPFIVYGAGYNYFRGEAGIPVRGIEHLQETNRYAKFFSVRNDGSYERMKEQTGLEIIEVPDPGFHVDMDIVYNRPVEEKYVIVQLAGDKQQYRFGEGKNKLIFIQKMRKVIEYLCTRFKVILTPHVLDDIKLCIDVAEGIKNTEVWKFGSFAFDRVNDAIAYYKYAEMVLAMRGHAQILPIGFNVPVISLENHDKNLGLMKKLSLEKFNVNIQDAALSEKVISLVEEINKSKFDLRNQYVQINSKLFTQTQSAMKMISDRLRD